MSSITTLHELVRDLERRSAIIGSMGFVGKIADLQLENDLLTFANQDQEKALVSVGLEQLEQLLGLSAAENMARRLLQETTFYGAFFEVATYGWLR
jgi:hypothetical protein